MFDWQLQPRNGWSSIGTGFNVCCALQSTLIPMMCYSNGIGLMNPTAIVGSLALRVKGAGAQSFAVPSIPDDREHKLQPRRHNTQ